ARGDPRARQGGPSSQGASTPSVLPRSARASGRGPDTRLMSLAPRVRAVVLDHDGGELTLKCLRELVSTQWPSERLEVVLVDNGSTTPVTDHVRAELPSVRVLRSDTHRGYAGGMNLGLGQLEEASYVDLVENSVTVRHRRLTPRAPALDHGQH